VAQRMVLAERNRYRPGEDEDDGRTHRGGKVRVNAFDSDFGEEGGGSGEQSGKK